MPKSTTNKTKRASSRRPRRPVGGGTSNEVGHPYIMEGDRPTHIIVPIDEYERLLKASMVESAVAKLKDEDVQWVDADQLGLELAGERISKARRAQGLTQQQLGKKLNLPQSQISRIERNPDRTTVRTLKRIARALGVQVGALV